jgi:hypothetical protein
MKAWKGLVGGWKENNFFGLHEVVEILSLIDGGRRLGWVLEICFWTIRSVASLRAVFAFLEWKPSLMREQRPSLWHLRRLSAEELAHCFFASSNFRPH